MTCAGCREAIADGQARPVTVTRAKHVVTVYAHEEHTEMARVLTIQDKSWQRDQSHYAG